MKKVTFFIPVVMLCGCTGMPAAQNARAESVWAEIETGCDLPCWNGIEPGVSTREDVDAFFDTYSRAAGHECIDFTEADEESRAGGYCYWESVPDNSIWGGVFEFGREGGERLIFSLFYLREPIPFSEAVAHFGMPGKAWAMQHELQSRACTCDPESPTESEEGGPDYDLLYPERGLILSAQAEQPDTWPCVCRTAWLDAITLVEVGRTHDLDGWWRSVYGYGTVEEGGLFFDFPGWEIPFEETTQ